MMGIIINRIDVEGSMSLCRWILWLCDSKWWWLWLWLPFHPTGLVAIPELLSSIITERKNKEETRKKEKMEVFWCKERIMRLQYERKEFGIGFLYHDVVLRTTWWRWLMLQISLHRRSYCPTYIATWLNTHNIMVFLYFILSLPLLLYRGLVFVLLSEKHLFGTSLHSFSSLGALIICW